MSRGGSDKTDESLKHLECYGFTHLN
ncbi:BnaC08g49530D [Brassica napus]|uniref:BnaC08g49530D protein n=1 Tax=Brassica napus TaxID=3708 RepID=A0A078J7A0_BRANA|nr:BnaC08g49530D [Brassica napus]